MESIREYFNFWNFLDVISLLCSLAVTLCILLKAVESTEMLRLLAAVASLCQVSKILDWLRLFDSTAFYIHLLGQAIYDIKEFLIIAFIALLLTSIPTTIIAMNWGREDSVFEMMEGHVSEGDIYDKPDTPIY